MPPLSYSLAIAILFGLGPTTKASSHFEHLAPQCRHVAIEMELLDPREARWFQVPAEIIVDINIVHGRVRSLDNAPYLRDVVFFPLDTWPALEFNRAYRETLNASEGISAEEDRWICNARADTDWVHGLYEQLYIAQTNAHYVQVRRLALKTIRDFYLDDGMFEEGYLPPPVPLCLFRAIQ
jgi:hypothetical protein